MNQRLFNDSDFALKMTLLAPLTFGPPTYVEAAFSKLLKEYRKPWTIDNIEDEDEDGDEIEFNTNECVLPEKVQPIVDYFEDPWVGVLLY